MSESVVFQVHLGASERMDVSAGEYWPCCTEEVVGIVVGGWDRESQSLGLSGHQSSRVLCFN